MSLVLLMMLDYLASFSLSHSSSERPSRRCLIWLLITPYARNYFGAEARGGDGSGSGVSLRAEPARVCLFPSD